MISLGGSWKEKLGGEWKADYYKISENPVRALNYRSTLTVSRRDCCKLKHVLDYKTAWHHEA